MVKDVVPSGPVTGAVAGEVTVKSLAFVPPNVVVRPVRSAPPVFEMVNVSDKVLPVATSPNAADPPSTTAPAFETETPISGTAVVVVLLELLLLDEEEDDDEVEVEEDEEPESE